MQQRAPNEPVVETRAGKADQKSDAELAFERKIRLYTRIFLVLVAFMAVWKAYALLAPKYLN